MANNVVNRTVNIFIQSGEAQKALDALIKKETKLKDELKLATDPKVIARLTAELQKLAEPIDRATRKVSGELEPSLRDTQAAARRLNNELSRMSAGDAGFEERVQQLRQANTELDAQKGKVGLVRQALNSFWKEAKTVAVGVVVGNTVQNMLETVMGYVTGMVTGSAKIADELADIEKTTGLTKEQVIEVNKELSKIDTRTSSSDLRKLAEEAGKLGAGSVEDVKKFVDQADKIKVALGEDLGEDAITSIGKLSKIFKTEMLNIGSAINEIGAKSEASERFSVDFLNRLAGTGPAVKLSAADLLGYGAALEIAGQTAEVSGTALSTFFIEFVRDSEKFGSAAGFAKGELKALINEKGTNAGFLEFLTRLKEANPDAESFLGKMQQLGIDGSRGANVMLALSNNIKGVKDQQLIANDAIQSNASIMNEFSKKNNNAAADLDKLKKNFAGLFTSSSIQEGGAAVVRTLNSLVNVLKGIPTFIKENKGALLSLAVGIALLNKEYFITQIAAARATAAKIADAVAMRLVKIAYDLAAISARSFSGSISAMLGPIGFAITTVAVLSIALGEFFRASKKVTEAEKLRAEVQDIVNEKTKDTVANVQLLAQAAADEGRTMEQRKAAIEALIKINPAFADTLRINKEGHLEGATAIQTYVKALQTQAEAEAKVQLYKQSITSKQQAIVTLRADPRFAKLTDDQIDAGARQLQGQLSGIMSGGPLDDYVANLERIDLLGKDIAKVDVAKALKDNTGALAGDGEKAGGVLEKLRAKLKGLQEEREKASDAKLLPGINKSIADTEEEIRKLEGGVDKLSKSEKKTIKDTKALADELQALADELNGNRLSDDQRVFQQLDIKYAKLREKAKGNNQLLQQVEFLFGEELRQLTIKQAAKRFEEAKKSDEKYQKFLEERKRGLEALNPLTAKLEGSALSLNQTLGRDKEARAELALMKKRGVDQRDERLKQLTEQKTLELANTDLTEAQKLLIIQKYNEKAAEIAVQFLQANLQTALDFAGQALSIFSTFGNAKTEKENAELARDKAINDKKKQNLEDRLKKGAISQQQYDREVQKIDKLQEKREKEARLKQFKRDQRMQVVQALMSGANAVVSTLAARPGSLDILSLGVFRAVNIGLAIAATAAQVAAIAGRKAPEFGRGGTLNGKSHAAGGMGVYDHFGRKQAEMEGDEGIINKFSMRDRTPVSISGTTSQIASFLNARQGGVHWEPGATVLKLKRPPAVAMNFPVIRKAQHFAAGGVFNGSATQQKESSSADTMALVMDVLSVLSGNIGELTQQMQKPIKAYSVLSETEAQQKRLDTIRDEATMKG